MGAYKALFIGGLIFAILFLIATVVLFFLLKIPKVFGVLTGHTQKKALETIRNEGQDNVAKAAAQNNPKIKAHEASVETLSSTLAGESGKIDQKEKKESAPVRKAEEAPKGGKKAGRDYTKTYEETEVLGAEGYSLGDGTDVLTAMDGDGTEGTDVLSGKRVSSAYDRIRSAMSYDSVNRDNLGYSEDDTDSDTDILSTEGKQYQKYATAAVHEYAAKTEDETDVLRASAKVIEDVDSIKTSYDEGYHVAGDDSETAVLRSGSAPAGASTYAGSIIPGGEADGTAVLTSANDSGKVIGSEEVKAIPDVYETVTKPGITVIYSKTVIHTDETL